MVKIKYDHFGKFIELEEELQSIIERYPYIEKINVMYEQNRLSQSELNELEYAFSNDDVQIVNNQHSGEFESYFKLHSDKLEICTMNKIIPMSRKDKEEEKGIESFENQHQGK